MEIDSKKEEKILTQTYHAVKNHDDEKMSL